MPIGVTTPMVLTGNLGKLMSNEETGCEVPETVERLRLLVFIVAYNADRTIGWVLSRIPTTLMDRYELEVLIIDDASADETFLTAEAGLSQADYPFRTTLLRNPVNQGYGGNQKLGFQYAITQGFDVVALVHGDGQYAPECLPELLKLIETGEADAVFGSRMIESGQARKGGMPLYKYVGNRVLTAFQNRLLRTDFSEFHSGYRVYTTKSLRAVPFRLNTDVFHFDTQIIIQLLIAGQRIREVPIPTYYGDEICHVDGLRYAWDVVLSTIKMRCQEYGIFYERVYDCAPVSASHYESKLGFKSPHRYVVDTLPRDARVVDLGGGNGVVAEAAFRNGCSVRVYDQEPVALSHGIETVKHDLNQPLPEDALAKADYVLLLDVIEHLSDPESFVENLRDRLDLSRETRILASTGNVAFLLTRLSLITGMFNYGKRGILDLTHRRLFTIASFHRLFKQAGFEIVEAAYLPGPFPLAFGDGILGKLALAVNNLGLKIASGLFAYQLVLTVQKLPTLEELLVDAHQHSTDRRANSASSDRAGNDV